MNDDRPRGELFRDPAAKVVWAGICALEEASQHDVLRALQTRLAVFDTRKGEINQKRARAIAALRQAADLLGGKSPSVAEYRRLQRENPALNWPADGTLRRWLGGDWNTALDQAHLDSVAEPLAAEPALGRKLSEEELTTALKECASELGRTPTSDQYMLWARRPDVRVRPGRRPGAIGTFHRQFGGWVAALEAAGLSKDWTYGTHFTNGHEPQYSDEELFQAMDEIRERLGGKMPTVTLFSAERRLILEEERASGKSSHRAFPSYNTGVARYGTWNRFKSAYKDWKAGQR